MVPPVALNPAENGWPSVAEEFEGGVALIGAGFTVSFSAALAVAPVASVTVAATVKVPVAVGVPVMTPVVDEMLSPPGNPEADHV